LTGVKYACENEVSATVESRSTVFKLAGRQPLFGIKTQETPRTGRIIFFAGDITMSKINHEAAKARDRGRNAARDDPDFALMRSAGSRVGRGKLRLVICPGCGRERYVEIAPTETRRRAKCTGCGSSIELW
jgi:hypothetical protein